MGVEGCLKNRFKAFCDLCTSFQLGTALDGAAVAAGWWLSAQLFLQWPGLITVSNVPTLSR